MTINDRHRGRCYLTIASHYNKAPIVGVEVGNYKGGTAVEMCQGLNLHPLYMVDSFEPYEGYVGYAGHKADPETHGSWADVERTCRNALNIDETNKGHKAGSDVVLLKTYSAIAVLDFEDESVDFVFLDANHDYTYVKEDLEIWYPKVKSGGWMMGHDWGYPGVIQAVTEFMESIGLSVMEKSGTDWWWQKP